MMNNLPEPHENNAPDAIDDLVDSSTEVTETIKDVVIDGYTQIPKPIREGLWEVFKRFCAASVVPYEAKMKSIANKIETSSDIELKLKRRAGDIIEMQMQNGEGYGKPLFEKYASDILGDKLYREQINLNKTVTITSNQIKLTTYQSDQTEEVNQKPQIPDEDWLNAFEQEASQKSSEKMRLLMGKILAGEIKKPSSFSIKTLRLIGQLDQQVATQFQKLCSLSISLYENNDLVDVRAFSLGNDADTNGLAKYGIGLQTLNILHEYGLITFSYNSWRLYIAAIYVQGGSQVSYLKYQNKKYGLKPLEMILPDQSQNYVQSVMNRFLFYGVQLTTSGMEIMSLMDLVRDEKHEIDMQKYLLNDLKLVLTPCE